MGGTRRAWWAAAAWALLGAAGCGSSGDGGAAADAATEDETATSACAAGETRADDGHCEPAGIPATSCGSGFEPDGDRGCTAILPADPCPAGQMAIPGETSCHDVRACADGTWGDIPVEASTQFVDGSFTGTSTGSKAAPWTHVVDAVKAASSGAIVAVAAGTYPEDVVVQKKSVRIWGRCPSMVTIEGVGLAPAAVSFLTGAAKSELHAVAVRGPATAVSVSGATDVVIDHVWTHATANRALDVENSLGPTSATVTDSLFEGAHKFGMFLSAATVTIDRSVVRGTQPAPDGTFGRGIEVENAADVRANVTLRGSIVEQSHEVGVAVIAADATIESSIVRDTQARASDGTFGRGIDALQDAGVRATLTVRSSIVTNNLEAGIIVSGADATVESTMITDGAPRASDGTLGRGVGAQDFAGQRGNLAIRACLVEHNLQIGIFVAGSDARIESTLVRDTGPQQSDQSFGRGIGVQPSSDSGERSTATIQGSVVESSYDVGVAVHDSDVTIEGVVVRDVSAQVSDGLYGDGISVAGEATSATATIVGSRIERTARAGVSSFGAKVTLGTTTLECAAIPLDGEPFGATAYAYDDTGGDTCGCNGAGAVCQVLSSGLAPPTQLPPS